ncbi:hypothetical protein [Planctomyces sp. SH-PL62]|uniref:hypothetical protein n=1 Tax=Planctomyces sp. SH-PL62 TaxID=1636152 RepID=UPI00078BA93F|nr:hypothetical protein [Planctomyces sp. SH-PL62]AMV36753.1 hypothetical protein VT85_04935 [Planctomyces sp. SH-PL62]
MNPQRRNLFGLRPADLLPPRSSRDILRRTAVRLGFCSIPYLAIAAIFAAFGDDRSLRGFGFWLCVVAVPSAGLLIDLVRLWRVRNSGQKVPTT